MSKMVELDAVVAELRRCGETLIGVSETLRDLFNGSDEYLPNAQPQSSAKALVLEDVRSVLAQKSISRHDILNPRLAFGRAVFVPLSFNGRYAMHTPAPKMGCSFNDLTDSEVENRLGLCQVLSEKRPRP